MDKKEIGYKIFKILTVICIVGGILMLAWLLEKELFVAPFIVSFCFSRCKIERNKYSVLHLSSVFACMLASIAVGGLGIAMSLPLGVSLISNVIVGCGFAVLTWYLGELIELRKTVAELNKKIEKLDLYSMTEDELRKCGASCGLSETQQDILVLKVMKSYKITEIMQELNYSRTAIKYHIARIEESLKISLTKKKQTLD